MTTSTPQPVAARTTAATLMEQHLDVVKTQAEQDITDLLDQHEDPEELLKALGMTLSPSLSEHDIQSVVALRLGISTMPKLMATVLGMGLPEHPAYLDDAVQVQRVVVSKSAERVLTDSYETAPVPTSKVAAQPGMVEALTTTATTFDLYRFADGSGFLKTTSTDSNRAFSEAWAQALSSPKELQGDSYGSMDRDLRQTIVGLVEPESLSAEGRAMVDQMIDSIILELVRTLTRSTSLLVPVDSVQDKGVESLITNLTERDNPAVWRSGVTITVNDQPVASPNALRTAVGAAPRSSLQESLARLNLARTTGAQGDA